MGQCVCVISYSDLPIEQEDLGMMTLAGDVLCKLHFAASKKKKIIGVVRTSAVCQHGCNPLWSAWQRHPSMHCNNIEMHGELENNTCKPECVLYMYILR